MCIIMYVLLYSTRVKATSFIIEETGRNQSEFCIEINCFAWKKIILLVKIKIILQIILLEQRVSVFELFTWELQRI